LENSVKKLALAVAAVFTALAPAAYGQDYRYRDSRDTARVIESTPVYEAGSVREECWNPSARTFELRHDGRDSTKDGTAIGAIAGGILGHQVDSGGGTIAGALLGGLLGNQIDRSHNRYDQSDLDLSRCRRVAVNDGAITGYDVRYVYRGQEYTTRMSHDPGRRLRVDDYGRPFGTVAIEDVSRSGG
jgi:uncharacterized protein YcfJ